MSKQLDSILSRATTTTPRRSEPSTVVAEPKAKPAKAKAAELKSAPKPKPEREKSIQVNVPASVARALNIRAAEEESTVRSLVLRGLKEIGLDISEDQIRDRRK